MKKFTKDELEDFVTWGEAYTEFGNSWADEVYRPLIEKVQKMIDNYDSKEFVCKYCGLLRSKLAPNAFCCLLWAKKYANE